MGKCISFKQLYKQKEGFTMAQISIDNGHSFVTPQEALNYFNENQPEKSPSYAMSLIASYMDDDPCERLRLLLMIWHL